MTDNHPITPSPELVQAFLRSNPFTPAEMTYEQFIATRFARWGADQELEACCEWVSQWRTMVGGSRPEVGLRAARRPQPPSLKEQALETLRQMHIDPETGVSPTALDTIRRALEALPND